MRFGKLFKMVMSQSPQSTVALRFLFTCSFTAASILSLNTMGMRIAAAEDQDDEDAEGEQDAFGPLLHVSRQLAVAGP